MLALHKSGFYFVSEVSLVSILLLSAMKTTVCVFIVAMLIVSVTSRSSSPRGQYLNNV